MLQTVTVSYDTLNRHSSKLLEVLADIDMGESIMATALTLTRLLRAGRDLEIEPEAERTFTEDLLEWCEAYQAEGGLN